MANTERVYIKIRSLPRPPAAYDQEDQAQFRRAVELAFIDIAPPGGFECCYHCGTGSPEGAVSGNIGCVYQQTDAAATTHPLWVKRTGVDTTTGWHAWDGDRGRPGTDTTLGIGDSQTVGGDNDILIGDDISVSAPHAGHTAGNIVLGKSAQIDITDGSGGSDAEDGHIVIGNAALVGNRATLKSCVVIGKGAISQGRANVIMGHQAIALDNAVYTGLVEGRYGVCIGQVAEIAGGCIVAIGERASSRGSNAVSLGGGAKAWADGATAIGGGALAGDPAGTDHTIGSSSTAVGFSAQATEDFATGVGAGAAAQSIYSTAIGVGAYTYADSAVAVGSSAGAGADYSTALGSLAFVDTGFDGSIAIGGEATVDAAKQLQVASINWPVNEIRIYPDVDVTIKPNDIESFNSNTAGWPLRFKGGAGRGTGQPGEVTVGVADVLGTGSTLQTVTTRVRVTDQAVAVEVAGFMAPIRQMTTTGNVLRTDYTVLINSGSAVTATLPSAASTLANGSGQIFNIKRIGAGTGTVSSSDNIDGAATYALAANESITVQSDGSTYWII